MHEFPSKALRTFNEIVAELHLALHYSNYFLDPL